MTNRKTLLRKLRRDRELTFDVLHLKTGINRATLSRAERNLIALTGEQDATLSKFFKVAKGTLQQPAEKAVA